MVSARASPSERLHELALQVHAAETDAGLARAALGALRGVVDADIGLVTWREPRAGLVQTLYDPVRAVSAAIDDEVHRLLHQHPSFPHRRRATSISDAFSRRAWRQTALYAEGHGRARQEDDLGVDLELGGGERLTLAVTRGRWGFRAEERRRLDLLARHVALAHRNLRARSGVLAQGLVVVDAEGRLHLAAPELASALGRHFRPWEGRLTELGRRWLGSELAAVRGGAAPRPLAVREGRRVLTLQLSPALVLGHAGRHTLSLREAWSEGPSLSALSPRERQVVELLADGRSNAQIAAVLGVAAGTVKRHLENVYAALGLPHRQAVALWAVERRRGG